MPNKVATLSLFLALTVGAKAQEPTQWPEIVSVQIVMDPVQARYPGNEHVKQCGPENHDSACFDPKMRHIVNRLYGVSKERCEHDEGVACEELQPCLVDEHQTYEQCRRWVPIGKPVFEDLSDVRPAPAVKPHSAPQPHHSHKPRKHR